MRVQRPRCGWTSHSVFKTRIWAAARRMRIGWVVEPGRVWFGKGGDVEPGGVPLAKGRGEWMGGVVHHDREGEAKGKGREGRGGDGYKRGGIIGNIMWKRKGGVKSGDGRGWNMTALRATGDNTTYAESTAQQHHRGPVLSSRLAALIQYNSLSQIVRFRFALRRSPTTSPPLPFPLRVLSAPRSSQLMRFHPPNPFSFSGIVTNRLFIRPRFLASDATSGPASSSQHPYLVPRNSRGTLPVYSDVRSAGARYLISIRNVEGNIKVCDPTPHDRSPLIRITKGSS
jgi:hypothetical protein